MFLGKRSVPNMHAFRLQSCIIQCMLIVMKFSAVGLIQKSVMKAMSIPKAMSSVSRLMSTRNAQLCYSTDLVTLCFDMLGHLGSHYLINFTNPARVPIYKIKISTLHKHAKFAMHLFFYTQRPNSSMQSSKVLCP